VWPHLAIYDTGLSEADVPERAAGDARVGGARLLGAAIGRPDPSAPNLGVEPVSALKPGESLGLRTFWQVEQPFAQDFFIFVHLVDADGSTVTQRVTPPWQGRFPTSSWHAGSLVVDVNDLPLPPNLAPGVYTLKAGMFDPATGAHPSMTLDGQPVDRIDIGRITITEA
jgi:hypothetical protein